MLTSNRGFEQKKGGGFGRFSNRGYRQQNGVWLYCVDFTLSLLIPSGPSHSQIESPIFRSSRKKGSQINPFLFIPGRKSHVQNLLRG